MKYCDWFFPFYLWLIFLDIELSITNFCDWFLRFFVECDWFICDWFFLDHLVIDFFMIDFSRRIIWLIFVLRTLLHQLCLISNSIFLCIPFNEFLICQYQGDVFKHSPLNQSQSQGIYLHWDRFQGRVFKYIFLVPSKYQSLKEKVDERIIKGALR